MNEVLIMIGLTLVVLLAFSTLMILNRRDELQQSLNYNTCRNGDELNFINITWSDVVCISNELTQFSSFELDKQLISN